MIRNLAFAVLLLVICTLANAQTASLLQLQRNNTLKTLREFRDILTPQKRTPVGDSLLGYTVQLINVAKTQNDSPQLRSLLAYFQTALDNYKFADIDDKASVIMNLNRDLNLKVHTKAPGQLNIENYENLFNDAKVNVLVDINGAKQTTGKYTLYWASFTGVDQAKIISKGAHDGNSSGSANPYALVITLPGYITFWVEETTSGKIYRSNPDYLMFKNSDDQSIEVNFVPQ